MPAVTQRATQRRQRFKHGVGTPSLKKAARQAEKHSDTIKVLTKFVQEGFNNLDSSKKVHACPGPLCCPRGAETLEEKLLAGSRSVLHRVPSPPAASKWTKLAPALQVILIGVVMRFWEPLWDMAYGALSCSRSTATSNEGDIDDAQGELDFHALNGKRFKRTAAFVKD
eukprot:2867685-Pyramimonas_sp.AAC.1